MEFKSSTASFGIAVKSKSRLPPREMVVLTPLATGITAVGAASWAIVSSMTLFAPFPSWTVMRARKRVKPLFSIVSEVESQVVVND